LFDNYFLLTCYSFFQQVRGPVPLGGSICPQTRNAVDGGVQSSRLGIDVWDIPKPIYINNISKTVQDYPIKPSMSGVEDLLVNNITWRIKQKRKRFQIETCNSDVKEFNKPPKKVFHHDHRALIVVVCTEDGSALDVSGSGITTQQLRDKLNFPSISSAKDLSSMLQHFYCFQEEDYDALCQAYPEGLQLQEGQKYEEQIDEVLKHRSKSICSLISLDKIVPPEEIKNGKYHCFVRQFAGDGAPDVDNTFITSHDIPGLQVNYKMARARDYYEHVPLSVGFFQSFCHSVQIQQSFIPILEKGLGRMGMYVGGRSVMNHRGGLSYVGPRKKGHMRQATVAEGPNEPEIGREHQFCFHRKGTDHKYWPFVHGLVNLLVGGTTLAAYHIYPHMAKLFPVSNSRLYRNKFCPSGILAINFCSSCHLDKSDDQKQFAGEMKERLRLVVNEFQRLRDSTVTFVAERYQQAANALKHILWWGVCLPTTCCYQYVGLTSKIEVYQFFMCPGLGTTYRIKNYWVHLFLAGLFSHCTSVAIFIVDGRAYFGKCPTVTMFSWGGT